MRLILALVFPSALVAQDLTLTLPLDCTLGETCYLQQFVDHDPTENAMDFNCGSLTYDTHQGTDFALPSLEAMAKGVLVRAAAAGTVTGTRDTMDDVLQTGPDAPDVSSRECGNGVVIDHGAGWETQYCHLARGSVMVRSGQDVLAGTPIGQVGLSGQTQFPHLHLTVRKDGQVVDPFDPIPDNVCGADRNADLWDSVLPTPAGGIIASGFAPAIPDYDTIKAGAAGHLVLSPSDALVAWVYLFGTRAGDRIVARLTGPDGEVMRTTIEIDRTQAQAFRAFGKRAPASGWPAGTYIARVGHDRGTTQLGNATFTVEIRP